MRAFPPAAALVAILSACAGAGPPPLGYGLPSEPAVTYAYSDTTVIGVSAMGQSMEIGLRGSAEYGVSFAPAEGGVRVTLTVEDLAASLDVPMAGSETVDESAIDGSLVFALDGRGRATVLSTPEVSASASRMISSLTTAHTFFPGLPDRVVAPGDEWVDTVSYSGEAEVGPVRETSIYRYTVVGETTAAGRDVLEIALAGTTEISSTSNMGGMRIEQTSTVEVEGHVLWDRRAGLMVEMLRSGNGSGNARVPIVPTPLPVQLRISQRATLLEG